MGIVYHGSKESGIKRLEPRKSTHGSYVYATPERVLALHFSGRSGDDLVYALGHFGSDREGPWELVELVPGAFERMYANSSSIYSLPDDTFEDKHTGFREVLSETGVDVIDEEYIPNVYDEIMKVAEQGLFKIYRYPNKPASFKPDGSDVLDRMKWYKEMGVPITKGKFDRLVYLHPELLDKINELAKEMGYDYHYEVQDLVDIFRDRVNRQLTDPDNEQYIEAVYNQLCSIYPELKEQIDPIFKYYQEQSSITPGEITPGRIIK